LPSLDRSHCACARSPLMEIAPHNSSSCSSLTMRCFPRRASVRVVPAAVGDLSRREALDAARDRGVRSSEAVRPQQAWCLPCRSACWPVWRKRLDSSAWPHPEGCCTGTQDSRTSQSPDSHTALMKLESSVRNAHQGTVELERSSTLNLLPFN